MEVMNVNVEELSKRIDKELLRKFFGKEIAQEEVVNNILTLGNKVFFLRRTKNLTQKVLAEKAGLSLTLINETEKEKRGLARVETILRLAKVFEIDSKLLDKRPLFSQEERKSFVKENYFKTSDRKAAKHLGVSYTRVRSIIAEMRDAGELLLPKKWTALSLKRNKIFDETKRRQLLSSKLDKNILDRFFKEEISGDEVIKQLQNIGDKIFFFRFSTGWSQNRLAKEIEVDVSTIRNIERGRTTQLLSENTSKLLNIFKILSLQNREQLVQKHSGLVASIAWSFFKNVQGNANLTIKDLIQEGYFGLFKAAEGFKPEKGFQFSTYATWWIRQAISRALINKGWTIRVPVHAVEKIQRFRKNSQALEQQLGRKPSLKEITEEMGVKPEQAERMQRLVQNLPRLVSLNTQIGEGTPMSGEGPTLEGFIKDKSPSIGKQISGEAIKEHLRKVVARAFLLPKEKTIIKLRYGLDDGIYRTLEKVGEILKLSRERIRQIEAKAIKKIKNEVSSTDYQIIKELQSEI